MRGRHVFLSACIVALASAAAAPAAAELPRIASMNVCTDQLLLTLADPDQILGLSRYSRDRFQSWAADDARRYRILSGGAEDILVLQARCRGREPVRQALDARASEGERSSPRRIRRSALARRGQGPDPRDGRDRRGIPIARRRKSHGSMLRSRARARPSRTSAIACCRCRGAAGCRAARACSVRC